MTIITAAPSLQRPVLRPHSGCRFVDLTIACQSGEFAFGASTADPGPILGVLCQRCCFGGGSDVIVLADSAFRSLRFEDCCFEAIWDGIALFQQPCEIDLYRCSIRSVPNAMGSTARLLFFAATTARTRLRAFGCSLVGTTLNQGHVADPVFVFGDGVDLHQIGTSILSYAPFGSEVDITIISQARVVASNNSTFSPTKVSGPVRFAPTFFEAGDMIEQGLAVHQAIRLIASFAAGKLSGVGTTTLKYRNAVADSTDRMTVTVDSAGNRTAITYDLT